MRSLNEENREVKKPPSKIFGLDKELLLPVLNPGLLSCGFGDLGVSGGASRKLSHTKGRMELFGGGASGKMGRNSNDFSV